MVWPLIVLLETQNKHKYTYVSQKCLVRCVFSVHQSSQKCSVCVCVYIERERERYCIYCMSIHELIFIWTQMQTCQSTFKVTVVKCGSRNLCSLCKNVQVDSSNQSYFNMSADLDHCGLAMAVKIQGGKLKSRITQKQCFTEYNEYS